MSTQTARRSKPRRQSAAAAAFAEVRSNRSGDYWSQTRQPLTCLVFLAPLLCIYEVGVLWLGGNSPEAIRNGADFWMRNWLDQVGLTYSLLLPALVIGGLLAWHIMSRRPWKISYDALVGMLAESLLFAFFLLVVGQTQDFLFRSFDGATTMSVGNIESARAITFIGAGIYEEVMFRLCLLPACYGVFRLTRLSVSWSAVLAVLATSLTFAFAHYLGPAADQFTVFSFTFRVLAGLFFAALFVLRGFGITVGCHAAYDLLVGVLLATSK